ncbi:hypothetical protein PoB_001597800 [Plakobranchus ocellatus]|uniref:Uncharacterized protein n=1 Tax=Plakobranchus ocellatus TaxID=259542 RepID=A0AAV3Z4B1_9GAST|nr:hypothetical protein PoB_001597800 [Plakobranchus ocellatus]
MAHALTDKSGLIQFLQHTKEWLLQLKCRNKTQSLPCLEDWLLSISALEQLWSDLSENFGFRFLLTSRSTGKLVFGCQGKGRTSDQSRCQRVQISVEANNGGLHYDYIGASELPERSSNVAVQCTPYSTKCYGAPIDKYSKRSTLQY